MDKKHLTYMRVTALVLSCLVATMTFLNILTVATHGIDLQIPDEGDFSWAVDPVQKRILFLSNFTVKNHGSFDIDNINIKANVRTLGDNVLIDYEEKNLNVKSGTIKTFTVLVPVYLDNLPFEELFDLLFEDNVFRLSIDIDVDYMFGLIHVTVDEVQEYPWRAPLAEYIEKVPFIEGVRSLLDIADSGIVQDTIIAGIADYVMGIESFEYSTAGGYAIALQTNDITPTVKELDCAIDIPVLGLDAMVGVNFQMWLEKTAEGISVNLKEVSFDYGFE